MSSPAGQPHTKGPYPQEIVHHDLPSMFSPEHEQLMRTRRQAALDAITSGTWRQTRWFEPITEPWIEAARNTDFAVDIGADLGFFTLLAAQVMKPGSRLIAIEADPVLAKLLHELPYPEGIQVQVVNAAAWDMDLPSIELRRPRGCCATAAPVDGDLFHVPAVSMDTILNGRIPGAMKMDIEGAEARAFRGMSHLLQTGQTDIFLEFHPWVEQLTPGGRQEMTDALQTSGYRIIRFYDDGPKEMAYVGGRMHLVPPRPRT